MTKADKRALAYAKSHAYLGYDYDQTYDAVKYGYLQAEKDLALTWEDMKLIHEISEDIWEPNWNAEEEMNGYKEVLRRFNETKNK